MTLSTYSSLVCFYDIHPRIYHLFEVETLGTRNTFVLTDPHHGI